MKVINKIIEHINKTNIHNNSDGLYDYMKSELESLRYIIEDVYSSIYHELHEHILNNDEDSWLPKYYTNNKLDYRKLLIGLLSDYENRLSKGISKDFDIYEN